MARTLNSQYMRRVMAKDVLAGIEAVFLTGEHFGVSVRNKSLLGEDGWIDDDAPRRYHSDTYNYRGWSEHGQLYCVSCWQPIEGIPREIVTGNSCPYCSVQFFPPDDEDRLDRYGNYIYREHVKRYTQVAVRHFRALIKGNEHIEIHCGVKDGYHKDHVYSVRAGFENDVDPAVIASPINIQVIQAAKNIGKGRRCGQTLDQLEAAYDSFLSSNPQWLVLLRASDEKELTFVCDPAGTESPA